MSVSFQLYSSRDVTSQEAFLPTLKGLGYSQVEGYFGIYPEAEKFRAALDAAGLTMPSCHMGLSDLEGDFDGYVSTAKTLGIHRIFAPYLDASLRPADTEGWKAFAGRLSEMGSRLADVGLAFGWHNHDFELVALADGGVPLDIILTEAPDIDWEGDLAWIARAGADVSAYVARYSRQLTAVHVKDLAPTGENLDEDGWSDVGTGIIDWPALVAQVRAVSSDILMVMEHDKPSDALRFATTSIDNFKSF